MTDKPRLTTVAGAPVSENQNVMTAGPRGPMLLQDVWFLEKLAHFDREVIPERRMHAKGSGAFGEFVVTKDISQYTKARIFSEVGKKTPMFARFSTVAGERGGADAERDIRGAALKFYTEQGNWDLVGNNTPVFFFRDPLKFPDLNHAVKRDPRTNMRRANNNWDFWTGLPEALHQITYVMGDRGIPAGYRHMPLFGVDLQGCTTEVTLGIGRATFTGDGGEAGEHRGLLPDFGEDPSLGVFADVVGNNKLTKRTGALGVHTTLGNHFAVEVSQLFQEPYVLQQHGAALAGGHYVLVLGYWRAGYCSESWLVGHIALSWSIRSPTVSEPVACEDNKRNMQIGLMIKIKADDRIYIYHPCSQ